jgi:hypothetical protein
MRLLLPLLSSVNYVEKREKEGIKRNYQILKLNNKDEIKKERTLK